ncbi:hypothetical protein J0X19_13905 [Hymenobacter sp. BT186]|uniref:Uncharacterized protein n=1 Tax=Hymenobacter telluris TaxID=2816474 RepID=A0A939J9Q1_9BACT|nr:hypothetical protein [Hymenobacter telluris]MBO0359049.1 hypothetical protein [Hymenobacter telluris]MBW3375075.1 hypothetical protein [Hymenobacter norwichensis]
MPFLVANRHFEIHHASDVSTRNGLGWELVEITASGRVLLIEIFRHDALKKIDFATFAAVDIPFEAIEILWHDFITTDGKEFIDESKWLNE